MLETILQIVSGVGTVATTANAVVDLVQKVKGILSEAENTPAEWRPTPDIFARWSPPSMQPFNPSVPDPFSGGMQWVPQLQHLAGHFGNPWVPTHTQGLLGINLTGLWAPPMNPHDQSYIRQFGPYLNMIAGVNGFPTLYAEGLFDPTHAVIHIVGQYVDGPVPMPMESRAHLLPYWVLEGTIHRMSIMPGPYGQPIQVPVQRPVSIAKIGGSGYSNQGSFPSPIPSPILA